MSLKISNEITFDKSGYFEALILGDKNYLQREDINSFKKLGISPSFSDIRSASRIVNINNLLYITEIKFYQ